jgi:DNA-binding LacI/PurR family transcriptional regulator
MPTHSSTKGFTSELRAEILTGIYAKGDWFPPERVLKDRFGTTHITIRSALAKLVQEGYIERYSGKGTLVIYSRDRPVASRRAPHFPFAQLLFAHMDETNAAILESLEEQLRSLDIPLRVSLHHNDVLLEAALYGRAVESGSLVILEPAGSARSIVQGEEELRNTIVVRGLQEPARCPQVIVDDVKGARDAVRYLQDLGHRSIAFLAGETSFAVDELRKGYEEEMAAGMLSIDPALMRTTAPGVGVATEACRQMLSRSPECRAFLCASDETAAGAIRALTSTGLAPGRDCSVIGYGNSRLALGMDMTSLDPGAWHLGEIVGAIALDMTARGIFGNETHRYSPELKIRATCGCNR